MSISVAMLGILFGPALFTGLILFSRLVNGHVSDGDVLGAGFFAILLTIVWFGVLIVNELITIREAIEGTTAQQTENLNNAQKADSNNS